VHSKLQILLMHKMLTRMFYTEIGQRLTLHYLVIGYLTNTDSLVVQILLTALLFNYFIKL